MRQASSFAFVPALAATPSSTLTVSGSGTISRDPDRATLSVSIVTNNDVAATATSANNRLYGALVDRMRSVGIAAGAIKTSSYDLNFVPKPPPGDNYRPPQTGFIVTRGLSITIDNLFKRRRRYRRSRYGRHHAGQRRQLQRSRRTRRARSCAARPQLRMPPRKRLQSHRRRTCTLARFDGYLPCRALRLRGESDDARSQGSRTGADGNHAFIGRGARDGHRHLRLNALILKPRCAPRG